MTVKLCILCIISQSFQYMVAILLTNMGVLKTYLLNSSFHGVPFTVEPKFHWTEKFYWKIIVIFSWCVCGYIMYSSYRDFKYNATSFTVDTLYLNWASEFPALVFCEKGNKRNSDLASRWFGKNRSYETDEILKDIVFFKGTISGATLTCQRNSHSLHCPKFLSNFSWYAEQIRSSCEELFGYCAWNNREFRCCNQIQPMHAVYGICYALNSLESSSQPPQPLEMQVLHKPNLNIGKVTIELLHPNIKIFALDRLKIPVYSDDNKVVMDGTISSPHKEEQYNVYLAVQEMANEKQIRSIDIKRRACRFRNESPVKSQKIYSYSKCKINCLVEIQLKRCKCNHHLMPIVKYPCDLEGLSCLSSMSEHIAEEVSLCICELPCTNNEVYFLGSVVFQNYTRFQNNGSVAELNFILRAPSVRWVRKVVNGYLELIVNLGSAASLCLGASILTIVELFYYFFVRPLMDYIYAQKIIRVRRLYRQQQRLKKLPLFPFTH